MKRGIIAIAAALIVLTACGSGKTAEERSVSESTLAVESVGSTASDALVASEQPEAPKASEGEFGALYDYGDRYVCMKMPELRLKGFGKKAERTAKLDEASMLLELADGMGKLGAAYSLSYALTKPFSGEPEKDEVFYTSYQALFDAAIKLAGVDTDALRAELSPVRNGAIGGVSGGYNYSSDKRWSISGEFVGEAQARAEKVIYNAQVDPNISAEHDEALEMINGLSEDWKAAFDQAKNVIRTVRYAEQSDDKKDAQPRLHVSAEVRAQETVGGEKTAPIRMVTFRVEGDQGVLIDKYKIRLNQLVAKLGDAFKQGKSDMDREILAIIGKKTIADTPKQINTEFYRFEVRCCDPAKNVGERSYFELSYMADEQGMPISTNTFIEGR